MWVIEYSNEVKFYFLDNNPYTFDLLVRIEELKYFPDAIPPEGASQLETPDWYMREILQHTVVYEIIAQENTLVIWMVKPNQ